MRHGNYPLGQPTLTFRYLSALSDLSVRSVNPFHLTDILRSTACHRFKRVAILLLAWNSFANAGVWSSVMPVYGGPANAVVVDSAGTVYATANSGIYKSTDGGQTWVSVVGDLPVLSVQAIAADPVNVGTLYAGTNEAMYKTVNAGTHWSLLNIPAGTSFEQIAVAKSNPNYVYATTNGSYVYQSSNGGTTWTQSSFGLSGGWSGPSVTTAIAVDPTNPLLVYTATWRGELFKSVDGANSWSVIGGGNNYWIGQLAIAPTSPTTLWAVNDAYYTSYGNILKSTDSGNTWTNAGQPAGPEDGSSIAVDLSNPGISYVSTSQGLYKTTGGGTWTLLFSPSSGPVALNAVAINPANGSQFFVASSFSGLYNSSNAGSTWQQGISGFADASITDLQLCIGSPSTSVCGGPDSRLIEIE